MPIKTIQPFVSDFNAFAGEGFYGNIVQGLVIKQLEDAVFIFGIAIDGTLIFRKRNYPDVSTWEDPKIIIHSNNWHKIYFVTDLGELIGVATSEKDGLMPSIQRMTTSYQKNQQKYCKIAEFENDTTGISMLISVFKNHENSSPSVVLLTGYSDGLSVNSIKRGTYLTNVYYQKKENKTIVYVKSSAYVYISTLCIGMDGSLKLSHENNLDLPSGAIEIPISWQEFSNIWELGGLIGINDSWFRSRIPIFKGDVETLVVSGIYGITPESINNPINGYGILSVFSVGNESRVMYLLISVNGATFIRVKYDKSDSKWKKLSLAS